MKLPISCFNKILFALTRDKTRKTFHAEFFYAFCTATPNSKHVMYRDQVRNVLYNKTFALIAPVNFLLASVTARFAVTSCCTKSKTQMT